jgi:hypothetical protein
LKYFWTHFYRLPFLQLSRVISIWRPLLTEPETETKKDRRKLELPLMAPCEESDFTENFVSQFSHIPLQFFARLYLSVTSVIRHERSAFGLPMLCSAQKNHSNQVRWFTSSGQIKIRSISTMNCEVYRKLRHSSVERDSLTRSQRFLIIQCEQHNLRQFTEKIVFPRSYPKK